MSTTGSSTASSWALQNGSLIARTKDITEGTIPHVYYIHFNLSYHIYVHQAWCTVCFDFICILSVCVGEVVNKKLERCLLLETTEQSKKNGKARKQKALKSPTWKFTRNVIKKEVSPKKKTQKTICSLKSKTIHVFKNKNTLKVSENITGGKKGSNKHPYLVYMICGTSSLNSTTTNHHTLYTKQRRGSVMHTVYNQERPIQSCPQAFEEEAETVLCTSICVRNYIF